MRRVIISINIFNFEKFRIYLDNEDTKGKTHNIPFSLVKTVRIDFSDQTGYYFLPTTNDL